MIFPVAARTPKVKNKKIEKCGEKMSKIGIQNASRVTPSPRQLKWQKYEYYCLLSFGMNTIKNVEWGDGFAVPESFWIENLNTDDWAKYVSDAGMSAIVFTAKHFDGFCLWQTEMTDYSVKNCPNWREGKGDLVADLANSCRKYGLGFGLYVSPWDRHETSYGKGKAYDDFFCGLLTELLTKYGDIFCVWFDPRVGTGVNGTEQKFDMQRYYDTVHALQPNCVIGGMGPDLRWQGNAKFTPRKSEWSVVPSRLFEGGGKKLNFGDPDLGSEKIIAKEENLIWYPLEVSIPLRDHWFYHKDDDYSAKTKDRLWKLYMGSVGSNGALMLGICPDANGKFHETDTSILQSFARDLKLHFSYNLLKEKGSITASSTLSELYRVENLMEDDEHFWRAEESDKTPSFTIRFEEPELFDKLTIRENIRNGQRVEKFEIFIMDKKGKKRSVFKGTTIGNKKICPVNTVRADEILVVFEKYREKPEILSVSLN